MLLARRTMRKVSLRVLPVTAAIYSISSTEKTNISLAAEGVMRDLSITEKQFGMISALYFLPYALLALPIVLAIKPYGPRVGLSVMAFSFGVVSMVTAAAGSFSSLLSLRLLLGATEGPVFPFTSYVVSVFFGHDSGATALAEMGIYAGTLKVIMAPMNALFLYIGKRSAVLEDWQALLLLDGVPAVIAGMLAMLILPSSPLGCARFLNQEEHEWLMAKTNTTQRERERRSAELAKQGIDGWRGILHLLRDARVITIMFSQLLQVTGLFGSTFFYPLILQGVDGGDAEGGGTEKKSIILIAVLDFLPIVLAIAITYGMSWLSDRQGRRLPYLASSALVMSLALLMTSLCLDSPFALRFFFYTLFVISQRAFYNFLRSYQVCVAALSPNELFANAPEQSRTGRY